MVDLKENHEEVDEWLEFWKKQLKDGDMAQVTPQHTTALWNNNTDVNEHWIKEPCISLFSTIVISAEGRVALCCLDSEFNYELGNINDKTIKEVWNGETIREYRKMHLSGKRNEMLLCRGCDCWDRSYKGGSI
mgnify:FL=1